MPQIWQGTLAALLLALGIKLGFSLRFRPLSAPVDSIRLLCQAMKTKGDGMTPRRALATGLAGSVGVGNLSGVACALVAGGPGAVFWMWIAALLGMVTAFAEGALAARWPGRGAEGYIRAAGFSKGSVLFCWACVLSALGMGGMAQANAAADALCIWGMPRWLCAVLLTGTALLFTGRSLHTVGKLTERLVPAMTVLFLLLCAGVLIRFPTRILPAFESIVRGAFGLRPCLGGAAGYGIARALSQGVVRGAFTNEAGLGTGPFAYGSCKGEKPAVMGVLASVQVLIDTPILCTLTAVCLLCAGWTPGTDGAALCLSAFSNAWGTLGEVLLAVCVVLFAVASMISWSAYGREALSAFCKPGRFFTGLFAAAVAAGVCFEAGGVLAVCDLFNLLMAIPNAAALCRLTKSGEPPLDTSRVENLHG